MWPPRSGFTVQASGPKAMSMAVNSRMGFPPLAEVALSSGGGKYHIWVSAKPLGVLLGATATVDTGGEFFETPHDIVFTFRVDSPKIVTRSIFSKHTDEKLPHELYPVTGARRYRRVFKLGNEELETFGSFVVDGDNLIGVYEFRLVDLPKIIVYSAVHESVWGDMPRSVFDGGTR